jgi:hypothetical protein
VVLDELRVLVAQLLHLRVEARALLSQVVALAEETVLVEAQLVQLGALDGREPGGRGRLGGLDALCWCGFAEGSTGETSAESETGWWDGLVFDGWGCLAEGSSWGC